MPDTTTVLLCDQRFHPPEPHLHFTREGSQTITFSSDLAYVSDFSERLDGVFGKGDHVTGPLLDTEDEDEQPGHVAPHGTHPEWPVQPCDRHVEGPHYHVTSGGTAFDPSNPRPSYNRSIHEDRTWHTQQGVRFASPDWIAENTPPEVSITVDDEQVVRLVEGSRYQCDPTATDSNGNLPWLAFDDGPVEVRFRCMSTNGVDAIVSGTAPTGGRTTQYVHPRHLSEVPTPTPTDDDGWAPGQKFRVTDEGGGHGFAVGTIVTSLFEPNHPSQNRLGYFHATTLNLDDYSQGSEQNVGTTAWVHGTVDYMGYPNVEPMYEPKVGDAFRITSGFDDHGFPEDTLVWVANAESGTPDAHANATRAWCRMGLTSMDPTAHQPWGSGTSANVVYWSRRGHEVQAVRAPEHDREVSRTRDAEAPDVEALLAELDAVEDAPVEITDRAAVIRDLQQRLRDALNRMDAERQERAEWIERLIERSRVVADREEWCGVYDAGMRELGLPGRDERQPREPSTTEVEVEVSAEIEVEVPIDEDHVASMLDGQGWDHRSVDSDTYHFTVNLHTVTATVCVTVDVDEDGEHDEEPCGCDEDVDWEDYLPSWVRDNGFSWSINERECSND